MSSETVSEHDQVIALMAEQGISRVKATKLLYEQSKQKKTDGSKSGKVEINVHQGENSVVRNQIDRFNSQRDLSNAATSIHHDIDMSQDGRPMLKLDAEASFRYVSTGPHISPLANIQTADEPTFEDPTPQNTHYAKKFPLRARADTESDGDDEVVAPYEEDKYNNSPAVSRHQARVESRTVSGAISGFDDGGWNGEIADDDGDAFNATTASRSNATPRRRSSNASLNSLRPLSRLHPNKFRDSMSTDQCDLDDESYSDSEEEAAAAAVRTRTTDMTGGEGSSDRPHNQHHHRHPRRKDTSDSVTEEGYEVVAGSFDGQEASSLQLHDEGGRLGTNNGSSSTQHTEHRSSSSHSQSQSTHTTLSTHSLSFSPCITPTGPSGHQPPSFRGGGGGGDSEGAADRMQPPVDTKDASRTPSNYLTNEQRQQQFSHGAQGSWSNGSQSDSASTSQNSSFLSQASTKNVQQLAVEEKLALLNAGRSPRHASFTNAPKLTPPSPASQQATINAVNVKVGTKKLTIRGAQSQSQEEMLPPPPAYFDEGNNNQEPTLPPFYSQRSLPGPPLPPPAYNEIGASPANSEQRRRRPSALEESMMDGVSYLPAEEPLPDFLPDSDKEDEDGLTQEQRTAALMAKYRRRSHMKPNATPEAFRDLEPVDPAVAMEALLRREQELKTAGTWVPPSSVMSPPATAPEAGTAALTTTTTTDSSSSMSFAVSSSATSSNVNTTESLAGSVAVPSPSQEPAEEYAHIVPTHTAVVAVMHKESNDLIEELVQQGYSRENAISLAKEIELDRRAGRFYNNHNGNFSPVARGTYNNNTNVSTTGSMGWQEAAAAANSSSLYATYNPNTSTSNNNNNNQKNAYALDDDLGSVISNISAASRQSNFGETDRLLMNLLLTQQKSRYGINMYESLDNSDEPQIERYMNRGMSLDQAVLKVFEKKYGPVESQQLPRQVLPYKGISGNGSVSGSSIAVDSDEAHEIVAAMHAEIELLMLSGNYSRDVAVRMLLNKVAKERRATQQAGLLTLDIDGAESQRHPKSLHRASSMNAMGSPTGRGNYVAGNGPVRSGGGEHYNESGYSASSGYYDGASERGERRLHSTRSMYDAHTSRSGADRDRDRGGGSVVSERSGRSHNTMPVPHHLTVPTEHLHDEYSAHYHEQEYARGPTSRERTRTGDKYVIHHHYQAPPPTPTVHGSSSTAHSSYGNVTSSSQGHKRRPSASNASVMSTGSSRVAEDSAYIPTLLAEQEAKYGVNMFEYLASDDPEVNRLMREFNFTRTDAMIAVFQQFPPQLATPTPTHLNSGASMKSTSSGGGGTPKGIAAHSPMKPPLINSNHNAMSGSNIHSSSGHHYGGSHSNTTTSSATTASSNGNRQPAPSVGPKASSAYDEDAELERVMKLSMQEHNNKPGAVSMPGTNTKTTSSSHNSGSMGGGSSQDVATLVGMGFTSAQAQTALARHNYDVHKAADYLLGSM